MTPRLAAQMLRDNPELDDAMKALMPSATREARAEALFYIATVPAVRR